MEISLCLLCERRGCLHICISMRGVARLPTYVFFGAKPRSVLWGKRSGNMEYLTGFERYVSCFLKYRLAHQRQKYGGSSPNSLQPISYFGSIWELYVVDLKTNIFYRKKIQLHFPMNKGLTVPRKC